MSWIEYRESATFQSLASKKCEHLRRQKLQTTNAFMDGRKLRDYYLSFYAPKFLIPISRSRLSVVMSHFLISARSDYYAIEPLYKTLISRYMSCGGELATLAALFLAPVASPRSRTSLGILRLFSGGPLFTDSLFLLAVTDFSAARPIIPRHCSTLSCK